ncbi:protocadherin gamma-B5-like [Mus pahari]|uniref:protocadherin gamma-B5-like n=1 Tax=Mus pahari TaxID=10093 RepID=UPI001114B013|nr:protocadherin gamma-B5-like [Mus pahari]
MREGAAERRQGQRRPMLLPFLLPLFCPALSEQIRYKIPEEMPTGSVVGNLAKDLGFSVQELPTRKLHISSEKPYFSVSSESGELLVSSRLDREQICGKKLVCALEFEAVAENPLNFYHLSVELEDINDHMPKFPHTSSELQISESAQPGTRFILEVAEDADIALNSLQNYKLSPSPGFSLVNKEKQDGRKYPELVLEKTLDREQQNYYRLVLTALDGGDPPLSGTTELRIQVTDANDNPPVFNQEVYKVRLPENVPPGTTVLRVTATDKDEGVNSEISYSLHRAGQVFGLNSKSGEITTQRTLDFEEIKEYSIVVEARDGGGLVAQCTVEINIQDENDNRPEITVRSLLETIPENTPPGTLIALIKIHDRDSGENGEVNCRLDGEVPFKIISSSKNSYKLVTDRTLDRELTPEYNVTIMATDRGKPPLSSSTKVTLHVGDVNDNAPLFHQASYLVYIAENNPPGASIAQVSASDPDLGSNGHVSYSIIASDLDLGLRTGEVRTARALGEKDAARHRLLVGVRDGGQPPLSATATLLLVFADSLQEALPDLSDRSLPPDPQAELQFYLVVALALISVLFLLAVILAIALRLRHSSSPSVWACFQPGFCSESKPVVFPNYSEVSRLPTRNL